MTHRATSLPRKAGRVNREELSQELLRQRIEREVDAEYTVWEKSWERGHRGVKVTPRLKVSWYRNRLLREIQERRRTGKTMNASQMHEYQRSSVKGANEAATDELYPDAVQIVKDWGKASTSLLQRRLRIGYSRAFHLLDRMQRDGIIDHDFRTVK
jgi:DNA segregation ATPase FtsK/SpoIIIE-like protein